MSRDRYSENGNPIKGILFLWQADNTENVTAHKIDTLSNVNASRSTSSSSSFSSSSSSHARSSSFDSSSGSGFSSADKFEKGDQVKLEPSQATTTGTAKKTLTRETDI